MLLSTSTIISFTTLSFLVIPAFGQGGTTNATCSTDLWSINEHQQTPCLVAAGLESVCPGQSFNIKALLPGQEYSGPTKDQSNKCVCSTVVYNLVSACGLCQGNSFVSWSSWIANCSAGDISMTSFPAPIPGGVAVPAWAYLNVTAVDLFDAPGASALASQNMPDSTAVPSPTGTGTGTGTGSSGGSKKKKTNTGAIAGGVVGGLVGLALILLGAFFLYKRHSRRLPPSSKFTKSGEKYDIAASPAFGLRAGSATPALPMQMAPPKLYDPADPSTFPTSPSPSFPGSNNFDGSTVASDSLYTSPGYTSPQPLLSVYSHHTSPSQSGRYAGIPEV